MAPGSNTEHCILVLTIFICVVETKLPFFTPKAAHGLT